jgi:hypothetical protein
MSAAAFDILACRPGHPQRPPDWRWRLARLVLDNSRLPLPAPDHATTQAMRLLSAYNDASTEATKAEVLLKVPDAADAFAFWAAGTVGGVAPPATAAPDGTLLADDAMARAGLEALILARQRPETVAKTVGLTAAAVRWYEAFFFDVRDRLGRPGWVAARVIGPLYHGVPAVLLPALVRAYGYYSRSGRVVRAVVGAFDAASSRAAAAADPARFFAADAVAAGGLKAALATRLAPFDARTYARMIELHHEAVDLETRAKPVGGAIEESYKAALAALASGLEYSYGDPAMQGPPQRPRLVAAGDDD